MKSTNNQKILDHITIQDDQVVSVPVKLILKIINNAYSTVDTVHDYNRLHTTYPVENLNIHQLRDLVHYMHQNTAINAYAQLEISRELSEILDQGKFDSMEGLK